MENEVDPEVVKNTQISLGKYVKRPPLSEKLLKKPPFRFLHDIVTTVLKSTGFFEGLFEQSELISENVKDRESKINFLTKVIYVVGLTTGKTLNVKPSKIVAGQEPEKTNILLQTLADALDRNLSSKEAVKNYNESSNSQQKPVKNKTDNVANNKKESSKKTNDIKKPTPNETSNKKTNEKITAKGNKSTVNIKQKDIKQKESTVVKDSLTKKTTQNKVKDKKDISNKVPTKAINDVEISEKNENRKEPPDEDKVSNEDNLNDSSPKKDFADNKSEISIDNKQIEDKNESYTTEDNNLNSSLSSTDLMAVENEKNEDDLPFAHETQKKIDLVTKHSIELRETMETTSIANNISPIVKLEKQHSIESDLPKKNVLVNPESVPSENSRRSTPLKVENEANFARPASVRPSSSRPGAPRPREKFENIISEPDSILVGKVNIIAENTPNEEEEDSSIVIVDDNIAQPIQNEPENLHLTANEHGHLVQQILDSQRELSQTTGKTEIEWQFGAQKARETISQEVEQIRFNIQALSRAANPLGKLLDHVQEDVEIMRQELQQWTSTYQKTAKEVSKQKTINEESLLPLHTKLKQLSMDIQEKRSKINDLKVVIQKNTTRIEKLLASGDVQ